MPRRPKKYHYIYKTTCLVTGKFYVGMHSTDDIDDGYLGSGKILGYSRKKYGDENHRREILEFFPTREALKLREKEIVNEDLLADPLNINLKYGGDGGWDHISKSAKSHSNGGKFKHKNKSSEESAAIYKKWWSAGSKKSGQTTIKFATAAATSDIARAKRIKTLQTIAHQQGEKNSQFGTCWVTNGSPVKIPKEHLHLYLDNGYVRGRTKHD